MPERNCTYDSRAAQARPAGVQDAVAAVTVLPQVVQKELVVGGELTCHRIEVAGCTRAGRAVHPILRVFFISQLCVISIERNTHVPHYNERST